MNFQTNITLTPLKVLMVNPLMPGSQLTIVKILSGAVFGSNQLIDLILLVYSNEKPSAEALKLELIGCAFSCNNSIEVTSDLPSFSDADVFCFMTNFPNPNKVDFDRIDIDEQFDTFYLTIKIAHNLLVKSSTEEETLDNTDNTLKNKKVIKKSIKPIIVADGLVTMDILLSFSKNIPTNIFFCPTSITGAAKSVLGDYLKVQCYTINNVHVWAANDDVLHVEVDKPIIIYDTVNDLPNCDWEALGKNQLDSFNLDHTQFNDSWMKKEFIDKVTSCASKNPYGCIFRAAEFAKTLQAIWLSRSSENGSKVYCNLGVISDGSLGTVKGYPYILPVILSGEFWTVNKYLEDDTHLKHEIKRINVIVKDHHNKLISYCKKFLVENVLNQAFLRSDEETSSVIDKSRSSI
ncbi:malate dehydrogenase, cytoplasmic-like [Achroia grisella]|uniref:malate dehydrogenase, cytoplasmic-like n=1 Tax=Achroia grisella TaxID=688607 RepID=UPI0027D27160|nr:malate dehydrogenase, cytoplasmic-like [Achroia grisella]